MEVGKILASICKELAEIKKELQTIRRCLESTITPDEVDRVVQKFISQ